MGFALSEIQLKSTAFEHQGLIPSVHTGEGVDVCCKMMILLSILLFIFLTHLQRTIRC